ncbi:MAG: hypothetical protein RLZZ244_1519 [Verrucomicrobiota bacterium]|jgi:hypothetical protein
MFPPPVFPLLPSRLPALLALLLASCALQGATSAAPPDQKKPEIIEELDRSTPLPSLGGIRNGDFEQRWNLKGDPFPPDPLATLYAGDESLGWRVEFGNVEWISPEKPENSLVEDVPSPAASGARFLDLNGSEPGAISQVLSTVPGQAYRVVFSLAGNPNQRLGTPAIRKMAVWTDANLRDGCVFTSDVLRGAENQTDLRWERRAFEFQASSAQTKIVFASLTPGSSGPTLDRVHLFKKDSPKDSQPQSSAKAEPNGDPEHGDPGRGPDYPWFLSPGQPSPEFQTDLHAFEQKFPPTSDGRSEDAFYGGEYGTLFIAARSHDDRYRILARRFQRFMDLGKDRHGYFHRCVHDTRTGRKFPMGDVFYYWLNSPEDVSSADCFLWHPSKPVFLATEATGRHRSVYQLWEIAGSQLQPVRNADPKSLSEDQPAREVSVRENVLERLQKRFPDAVIGSGEREVGKKGTLHINSMRCSEHPKRWEGNDLVLEVSFEDWWREGESEPVSGPAPEMEGRVRYVPGRNGHPSQFKVLSVGKLPAFR